MSSNCNETTSNMADNVAAGGVGPTDGNGNKHQDGYEQTAELMAMAINVVATRIKHAQVGNQLSEHTAQAADEQRDEGLSETNIHAGDHKSIAHGNFQATVQSDDEEDLIQLESVAGSAGSQADQSELEEDLIHLQWGTNKADSVGNKSDDEESSIGSENYASSDGSGGVVFIYDHSAIDHVYEDVEDIPFRFFRDDRHIRLPQIMTRHNERATLDTPIADFLTWLDYKTICLGGPHVTFFWTERRGQMKITCAVKILKDCSELLAGLDLERGRKTFNIQGVFTATPIAFPASTFVQWYEMLQAGGVAFMHYTHSTFKNLVDLYLMANILRSDLAMTWIEESANTKYHLISATWEEHYKFAKAHDNDADNSSFPAIARPGPVQEQAAVLVDIQQAWMTIRLDNRARLFRPAQLAQLVSVACPWELRARMQIAGQLVPDFVRAVALYDIRQGAQARRDAEVRRDAEGGGQD